MVIFIFCELYIHFESFSDLRIQTRAVQLHFLDFADLDILERHLAEIPVKILVTAIFYLTQILNDFWVERLEEVDMRNSGF